MGSKTAKESLVKKVINGGSGVWGDAMMPAHTGMSNSEVSSIISYVLSLSDKKKVLPKNLPVTGSYTTNVQPGQTNKGSFIFRAAYKDRGAKLAPAQTAEHIIVLRSPTFPVVDADGFSGIGFNANKSVATPNQKGSFIQLKNIDLTGIKAIELNGSDKKASGAFEVRLGAEDGKVIGRSSQAIDYKTVAAIAPGSGKHNLYIVFTETMGEIRTIQVKN